MAPRETPAWAYEHCEQLVRDGDRERYVATLYAPAEKRPHLFALYAFSQEVARVRDTVSTSLPGEIRLQWWRDALQGEARGDVRSNPVAAALDDTLVRFRLPRQALVDLVDARVFDLYDDPMPGVNDLEGYCGETASVLIRLASLVLADGDTGAADAAGHAGVAQAVTGLLRAFPWHVRRGQLYLPPVEVLTRQGLTRNEVVAGQGGAGLATALAEMRGLARRHLDRLRTLRATVTPAILPAFLPVALVPGYLAEMERREYDPYATLVDRPEWRKQFTLWRAAQRGRV